MIEPILTREQMRAYDAFLIDECGVPGVILMENAGRGAAEIIASKGTLGPVCIVCGSGNNGGDGFVVARHLLAHGVYVEVVLVGELEKVEGDAKINLDALVGIGGLVTIIEDDDMESLELSLETATIVVDAIFGTGLARPIEGRYRSVIQTINDASATTIALDLPSGIDANTGQILGVAIDAEETITFGRFKAGLFQGAGVTHAGEVSLVPLGVPDAAVLSEVGFEASLIAEDAVAVMLGERSANTHKYRAGSVLVVAGSEGKLGAALLTARGVLRSGAGVATIATWPAAAAALGARIDEVMTLSLDANDLETSLAAAFDRRAAVAIGPGLGTDERARSLADAVVLGFEGPVVVDADAVTCFAGRPEELKWAKGPRILTPHAGELGRLLGKPSAEIEAHRFAAAREAASLTGCTIVLKGPHTVIATDDTLEVCAEGNPVLATAGSGDVLTGITAAMLCNLSAHEAACAAVLLHARAGDQWAAQTGADRGMLAGEIADGIPKAIASLS